MKMEIDLDANNNNSTDKKGYSLRPRAIPRPTEVEDIQEDVRKPRSRVQKPSKQKTLPLSKYRRKTANARERSRMREINEAFETLRKSIPLINTKCDSPTEKNTKISTLRLAMKYITVLTNALRESDGESDKDSIFSEYSFTPPYYRDSYTPTSTSDNSDFSDSFLINSISNESLSPLSSSSSINLPDISSKLKPPRWNISSEKTNLKALPFSSDEQSVETQGVGSPSVLSKIPPSFPLSRLTTLEETEVLDPSSTYSSQLTPLESDLRFSSLTPISLQFQSTPVLEDWEDLNFSRVDFDELLST